MQLLHNVYLLLIKMGLLSLPFTPINKYIYIFNNNNRTKCTRGEMDEKLSHSTLHRLLLIWLFLISGS